MTTFTQTPEPPYYAVVFISTLKENHDGYGEAADEMLALARTMPGFYGEDSLRTPEKGMTVSYWKDEASMIHWRKHPEHLVIQARGKDRWYSSYISRVAKVERDSYYDAE